MLSGFGTRTNNKVSGLILTALLLAPATLPAYAAESHEFRIAATDSATAIHDFATQSGVQILAAVDTVQGKRLNAVAGEHTTDEGLKILLKNTGLVHQYMGERAVALVSETAASKAAEVDTKDAKETQKRSLWERFRLAQADQTPAAGGVIEQSALEEIIVTAQKQGDQRLLDVPVPVTVVNTQTLTDNNQLRLRDFYYSVPGLSVSPDIQGVQHIAIRGITGGRAAIPTVGITIDDIPFGFTLGEAGLNPDFDPGDLARIEVLRGPQGTLYGANSMGGLMRYVTTAPSMAGYSGRVAAGLASVRNSDDPSYNLRASANIPLSDTFAVRASGFLRQDAGYIDDAVSGEQGINRVDTNGGLLKALWQPSDVFSLTASVLYQHAEADGLPEADVAPGLRDLQKTGVPGTGTSERELQAYSLTAGLKLGAVELTSLTGYGVNEFSDYMDSTGIVGGLANAFFGVPNATQHDTGFTAKRFTEELRLSAPIGARLQVLAGLFHTDEEFDLDHVIFNATDPLGTPVGLLIDNTELKQFSESAFFANLTYQFTDRFDLQVGGRYSNDTSTNVSSALVFLAPPASRGNHVAATTDATTFLVTPRFKLSPDVMLYARVASGYRPGGFNDLPGVPPTFDSDKTINYEIGLKGDFLDHKLVVDTSLYYIDWQDIQVRKNGALDSYKTNGSSAKSEGIELSVAVRPSSGLKIDAWVAYNNAVLTETLLNGELALNSGARLPFSSRISGNLSLEQEFPVSIGMTGFVGGSVSYVGDRISNFTANDVRDRFAPYATTDLRAGVRLDSWSANLFVNNAADRRGVVSIPNFWPNRRVYIQPRTIGLNVTKTF